MSVREVLAARVTNNSFKELRTLLCDLYEPTPEQHLDEVFGLSSLGDKWPSQFARELDRLCEGMTIDDIKTRVLLKCLPPKIMTAVAGTSARTYRAIVDAADKTWARANESSRLSVSSVGSLPRDSPFLGCSRSPALTYQPRLSAPTSQPHPPPLNVSGLCKFHLRYGDNARACTLSCPRWPGECPRQVFTIEEEEPSPQGNE